MTKREALAMCIEGKDLPYSNKVMFARETLLPKMLYMPQTMILQLNTKKLEVNMKHLRKMTALIWELES